MAKQEQVGPSKSDAVRQYLSANPKAGAKVVQTALKEQGIEVSIPLVNKIKYLKPEGEKKSSGTGKRGRPVGGEGNLSDVIRSYIRDHADATRPQIRDALRAQGHNVSTSLVNAVYLKAQSAAGKPITAARRGRPAGRPSAKSAASVAVVAAKPAPVTSSLSAVDLINAKKLADQLGGVDRLKQALSLLEQLS